jgi:uncharacterized protein (DUF433 family)
MQVEDYLEFVSSDEIRIRGHRVWLEHVLEAHLGREMTPAELLRRFPTLSMEQVLAALLYYHANRPAVDAYLSRQRALADDERRAAQADPKYDRLRQARDASRARLSA